MGHTSYGTWVEKCSTKLLLMMCYCMDAFLNSSELISEQSWMSETPPRHTKLKSENGFSTGAIFRYGSGSRCNTTCAVQKWGFFREIEIKYMGRPLYLHWNLRIIHPVIAPIWNGYKTLKVHLVKSASNGNNISKGGDVTHKEPMDSRWPTFTGAVKDILSEPTLAIPEIYRKFYIKTDLYKDRMVSVILQADDSD